MDNYSDRAKMVGQQAKDNRINATKDWAKSRQNILTNMSEDPGTWAGLLHWAQGVPSDMNLWWKQKQDKSFAGHDESTDKALDELYDRLYRAKSQGMEPESADKVQWSRLLTSGEI